jgi:acyl-CoA thioester hydrolase
MITTTSTIRVRYDEVDKMGYVYHGNYSRYYHISRTELLRAIGICDKELENHNVILPVTEMHIRYYKPVYYDDTITIKTSLKEIPRSRMKFIHEVINQNNEVINQANSTVAFVDYNTRKAIRIPSLILQKIESYIKISEQ